MAEADELTTLVMEIQRKVRTGQYRLTLHTERERDADQVTKAEIEEAILSERCEVIENYPDDPRGASCLVLGFTKADAPLHFVCGVAGEEVVIITLYRPDPNQWIDWRVRKGE